MAIRSNVIVRYNVVFLPGILLLTQAPFVVWFDGVVIVYYYYLCNYVLRCLLFCFVWWPGMAINVSVQHNDGFLPDILLLIQAPIVVALWFDDIIIVYYYYILPF